MARALPWYTVLAPGEKVPVLSYYSSFGIVRKAMRLVPVWLARAVPAALFRQLA